MFHSQGFFQFLSETCLLQELEKWRAWPLVLALATSASAAITCINKTADEPLRAKWTDLHTAMC